MITSRTSSHRALPAERKGCAMQQQKQQRNEHNCPRCGAVAGRNYRDQHGAVRGIFLLVRVEVPPTQVEVDGRVVVVAGHPILIEVKIESQYSQLPCATCGKMFTWWSVPGSV